jgi:hypothetical protein
VREGKNVMLACVVHDPSSLTETYTSNSLIGLFGDWEAKLHSRYKLQPQPADSLCIFQTAAAKSGHVTAKNTEEARKKKTPNPWTGKKANNGMR